LVNYVGWKLEIKQIGAWIRHRANDRVLVVSNASNQARTARITLPRKFVTKGFNEVKEILTEATFTIDSKRTLTIALNPYQFMWINIVAPICFGFIGSI